ncbi:GNAT family N-acetyltransferase [Chromobacterium phragmitis]|uniref:GNAT family N-acetyltransferase n=1 Tax=Chromobacterium phragmitis TaxID=2202141 RepID=UPI000DEC2454|nr:GNAT family N-acetyltransferase [Chromobacterium phragmitis]AXE31051.1 GNAT family N-acetyltransferase [Chromobacterium phragmitis]
MKLSASATIVSSTWAIRRLNTADIGPDWLDGFQRRQDVTLVYRGAPGDRRIATEPFIDDWSADERRALCRELAAMAEAGRVWAAMEGENLAGFAAVSPEPLGPDGEYRQLKELQVDARWRGRGLGRELMAACVAGGRAMGARKLYISSHSAIETVSFYERSGCVPARWLHAPQVELEPFDWQMEYDLER